MVNLERMPPAERLDLCRKYFFIGLGCLPLVWLVNCLWFYQYAFCPQAVNNEESKSMKKYLTFSLIGLVFWTILIVVWLFVYTASRAERTEWAEYLTLIFPLGRV